MHKGCRRSCPALVVLAATAVLTSSAAAQEPPIGRVVGGERVVVTMADGKKHSGLFVSASRTDLRIMQKDRFANLPLADINRIIAMSRDSVWDGTRSGLVAGAIAGAALGSLGSGCGSGELCIILSSKAALVFGLVGAGIGAGIGFAIDAIEHSKRTVFQRPLGSGRLAVAPWVAPGGLGVQARIDW